MDKKKKNLYELALKKFNSEKVKLLNFAREAVGLHTWQLAMLMKLIDTPTALELSKKWLKILTFDDTHDPEKERKINLRIFRVRDAKITIIDLVNNSFNYEVGIKDKYAKFKPEHRDVLKNALINDLRGLNLVIAHVAIMKDVDIVSGWDELLEITGER